MTRLTGLVVHFESTDDRKVRLAFHDVHSSDSITWKVEQPFTHVDLEKEALSGGALDSHLLKTIGENLLVRLAALAKTIP